MLRLSSGSPFTLLGTLIDLNLSASAKYHFFHSRAQLKESEGPLWPASHALMHKLRSVLGGRSKHSAPGAVDSVEAATSSM